MISCYIYHKDFNILGLEFLNQVKQDIQEYFGGRGEIRDHVPGLFRDLNKPLNLGLFFCIQTKDELDQVRVLLGQIKESYQEITALVFSHGHENIDVVTHQSIYLFDFNDFTLFGKKKELLLEKYQKERFELLVSFAFDPDPFCKKLVADINAEFKVGPFNNEMTGIYDMTLAVKPDLFGYMSFFEQVKYYLSILNIKP